MNTFIKSILVLSVISGIGNSILTSNSSIKRYINYFISLLMVLVILLPLSKILISFDNVKEYINDITHNIKTEEIINNSNELIITNSEKKICDGIKEMIITKFNFDTTDILVELVCNKNDINSIKIEAVNVILTNKASWSNVDSVKEYLDQNLGCKVNVTRR